MWNHVVALADKKRMAQKEFHGVPIIAPSEIASVEYDCIAVFSNRWFEEIKARLVGEYFVSPDCVISWRDLITERPDSIFEVFRLHQTYIREHKFSTILDFGMSILPKYYLAKQELLFGDDAVLGGMPGPSAKRNLSLYDYIYEKESECAGVCYDAAIVWDTGHLTERFWTFCRNRVRNVLFYTPYLLDGRLHKEQTKAAVEGYGSVECLAVPEGLFWCVNLEPKKQAESQADTSIFVVTHKEYNVRRGAPYRPLCVGGYWKDGFLTEQNGDNIAYLNPKINECTALYWIWKNTSEQYVGLNHYRRHFYRDEIISSDNYLDAESIADILRDYDIILPRACPFVDTSIFEQLYALIDKELYLEGYRVLRDEIARKQPDYLQAFEDVMSGNSCFWCNLFVTRRDILNRYCEWLFSFLIDAASNLETASYDPYSQRVMGFFAERMMTVWLRKQRLNIKELPWMSWDQSS